MDTSWEDFLPDWDRAEWRGLMDLALAREESGEVREATRTGAPLGSVQFVSNLEEQLGRSVRVLPRGR